MRKRGFLVPMEEEGHTDPDHRSGETQIIFQGARNPSFQFLFRALHNRTPKSSHFTAFSLHSTLFENQYDITVLPFILLLNDADFL